MLFSARSVRLILLTIISLWLVSACYQRSEQNTEFSQSSTENCQIIQHALGDICIPQNPQSFIALDPGALGNAISLGVEPIGSVVTNYDNQFPDYLKSKAAEIESVGNWGQPSLERVALLRPDLMIGIKHNYESIYPQLSSIAPTALYDWRANISNQDNWKEYFNFVANVMGQENAAKQVWGHYNQRIEQLKTTLGDRYKDKTISFINFCCGGIYSQTVNSFTGSVLDDLGLQRPESQRRSTREGLVRYSKETLRTADGDVMFVVAYGGDQTGKEELSRLQQTPLWQKLKAVQQNRVYYVDPTVWIGRTPLAADTLIDDLYTYLVNDP